MAVLIGGDKAFLHIPKTAGMWIRATLTESAVDHTVWAPAEASGFSAVVISKKERHHLAVLPDYIKRENVFCILRDPAEWYESFWLFRVHSRKWRWDNRRPLDQMISEKGRCDFEVFVHEMQQHFPEGFLSELYAEYTGKCGRVLNMQNMKERLPDVIGRKLTYSEPANVRSGALEVDENLRDNIRLKELKALEMFRNAE